jgi:cyanate permease
VLIGPPLFGAIASVTGSYGAGFVVIAALPLLASVGLFASRGRGSVGGA